ncbi:unnamed protein product [Amoebophrya sp. A120]|nr:unnamed protein product [Amoebophrya sp. A120]|eukprot:GSA120T00024196001.1
MMLKNRCATLAEEVFLSDSEEAASAEDVAQASVALLHKFVADSEGTTNNSTNTTTLAADTDSVLTRREKVASMMIKEPTTCAISPLSTSPKGGNQFKSTSPSPSSRRIGRGNNLHDTTASSPSRKINNIEVDSGYALPPLQIAAGAGHREVCEFFVAECDLDVNVVHARTGTTALMHACRSGATDIVKLLLAHKAIVLVDEKLLPEDAAGNAVEMHERTALHFAALSRDRYGTLEALWRAIREGGGGGGGRELMFALSTTQDGGPQGTNGNPNPNGRNEMEIEGAFTEKLYHNADELDLTPLDLLRKRHLTGWVYAERGSGNKDLLSARSGGDNDKLTSTSGTQQVDDRDARTTCPASPSSSGRLGRTISPRKAMTSTHVNNDGKKQPGDASEFVMVCARCRVKNATLLCQKCGRALYCSTHCQHKHWPLHKRTCAELREEEKEKRKNGGYYAVNNR